MKFSVRQIPFERRLQTAAVFLLVFFALCCLFLWVTCIINPFLWFFYVPYLIYASLYKPQQRGGWTIPFIKNLSFWRYFSNYYPASVEFQKSWNNFVENKKQKYLFAIHPHGVASLSVWANILSNGTGFYDKLEGLNLKVVTLPINFYIPIWKEFLTMMGMIDSHERSIINAIRDGSSVAIVVGGAAEALDALPQSDYNLTIKKRRGFIRVAIQNGCALVPVFCFGENDLFHQTNHAYIRKIQKLIKKYVGFSTPVFRGRGIFNYDIGLLPHRKSITTVFGAPIPVEQNLAPSSEMIEQYHELYMNALDELYSTYAESCGSTGRKLNFI